MNWKNLWKIINNGTHAALHIVGEIGVFRIFELILIPSRVVSMKHFGKDFFGKILLSLFLYKNKSVLIYKNAKNGN